MILKTQNILLSIVLSKHALQAMTRIFFFFFFDKRPMFEKELLRKKRRRKNTH